LNNDPAPHLSPEMNGSPGQNGQAPSTPARTSYSTSSGAMPRPVDGSGATPRTTTTPQQQWTHGGPGYSTPPRSSSTNGNAVHPPPSRDLFLGSEHSETNGNASAENSYTAQSGLGVSLPPQGPSESFSRMNGSSTPSSNKRIREMDDDEEHGSRPSSRGHDERLPEAEGVLKRRKTIREGSTPSVALTGGSAFDRNNEGRLNRTRSAIAPNRTRNR
jgi:protein SOK2